MYRLTDFSDSHVSVSEQSHVQARRNEVNSLGSTGLKYSLSLCPYTHYLVIRSSAVAGGAAALHTQTAAGSRCFEVVERCCGLK